MDIHEQINLLECPICQGSALLEEENGWCFYVTCMDCGSHTAEVDYKTPEQRLDAAQRAANLWNMGKVLSSTPGE